MSRRIVFMTGGGFTPGARQLLDRVNNPLIDEPVDPVRLKKLVDETAAAFGAAASADREPQRPAAFDPCSVHK